MQIQEYVNKQYIQALLIGFFASVFYKLLYRSRNAKNNQTPKLLELAKIFLAATLASIIVLYTLHFTFAKNVNQSGGGNNLSELQPTQPVIMTGKPSF